MKTVWRKGMNTNAERFQTTEKATMQVIGKLGFVNADLKNISRTGACLEWNSDSFYLAKGDLVNLTIQLLSMNRKYNMNAQVVWRVGKRTGVQFMTTEMVMEQMMRKKPA